VCLGFDHVVANLYFVPTAIFHGHPAISTTFYIWKSLLPALLGNIVGGGLFVVRLCSAVVSEDVAVGSVQGLALPRVGNVQA
jgi:formate/nitrite transporter FocA (FNT family)